ncbi:MAG TPA: EAL domain-containing protein, partial [Helicobacteraceae bacterium]|nr:EAL domain-containing protein [Helicobacteraceae bacterium]
MDLPDDEDDIVIVGSIIALAKSLKLNIIAEGVETEAQKAFLIESGCSHFQGFLYSKPLPADAFKAYLLEKQL